MRQATETNYQNICNQNGKKKTMKTIIIIAAALVLTGCATTQSGAEFVPLIDGSDRTKISADLGDCQAYARQVAGAADRAVAGALAGALIGGVLNAALGVRGQGNEMAAFGAITGGLQGAGEGAKDQKSIIRNCMAGRGHRVLN
jgi:outer membrane lipoprotein SlyB